jgi:glyoxylase-like metal-dependent hydrolase (beta-lactamase superfamily II)
MTAMSVSEFVSTRRIGDADVTVISEGTLVWAPQFPVPEEEWRAAMPDADERGAVLLGLNVAHVRIGDASILIDPGCDVPGSAWQDEFARRFGEVTRTPGLLPALQSMGVRPEEVTHVLITHGHGDHVAGLAFERDGVMVPRFPNARHYIGRADWEENPQRSNPESEISRYLGAVERAGLLEVVDEEREIVPGVTMIPAPGESRGHSVVRVDSNGERFFYLGDLFHHAAEVANIDWVSPGRDVDAMRASRQRVLDESLPTSAIWVFSHELFPAWGQVKQEQGKQSWVRL